MAVMAALVGCSADADPKPLPPLPRISPTPAVLTIPPEATEATAAGAAAFVEHYLDVLTRAFQTADASQLRVLSDPDCGGCKNFIGAVAGSAAAKESTQGGEFALIAAESPPVQHEEVIVELRYARAAAQIVDANGHVRKELPPDAPVDAQMRLQRRGTGWVVLGFRATPQ